MRPRSLENRSPPSREVPQTGADGPRVRGRASCPSISAASIMPYAAGLGPVRERRTAAAFAREQARAFQGVGLQALPIKARIAALMGSASEGQAAATR